jgi:nitrate reductase NapAB chaperone NapD
MKMAIPRNKTTVEQIEELYNEGYYLRSFSGKYVLVTHQTATGGIGIDIPSIERLEGILDAEFVQIQEHSVFLKWRVQNGN